LDRCSTTMTPSGAVSTAFTAPTVVGPPGLVSRGNGTFGGQGDPHHAAGRGVGHLDRAAVQLDGPPDDRQAKPRATRADLTGLRRGIAAGEALEHAPAVRHRDPRALVHYVDLHRGPRSAPGLEP